jgi:hypothetical protein
MLYEKSVSIMEHMMLERFKDTPVLEQTRHFPHANKVVFDPTTGDFSIYEPDNQTEPKMTSKKMAEDHVETLGSTETEGMVEYMLQHMRENYLVLYTTVRMKLWQIDVYFGWDVTRDDRITRMDMPFQTDIFGYAAGMGPRILNTLKKALSDHLSDAQMDEIDWIFNARPGAGNPYVNATLARRQSWKAASTPLPPAA